MSEPPVRTVLFLCTGNYYRSRFAEVYFNWHAEQRGVAWRAESRGLELFADNVGPMSMHAIARLRIHGIPIGLYRRLPLAASSQDFEAANHVVAIKETEHRPMLQRRFPNWLDRVEFWEIHDLDCADPEEAMPCLEAEVVRLIERLGSQESMGPGG
jgi:protein-tyrosine phosphatase